MPGRIKGSDTLTKVCQLLAPRVPDASSSEGLTPSTTPINVMKAIGAKASICDSHTPVMPYSQRLCSMPNRSPTRPVMAPLRPNSRIRARPSTKGGVTIGNMVMARMGRTQRPLVRVTSRANTSPRKVADTPVSKASARVFQATPQRPGPATQLRLQIPGSARRRARAAAPVPPSSMGWPALTRISATGNSTNREIRQMMRPMAPATKASPRQTPQAAAPDVRRNSRHSASSSAPKPRPVLAASGPQPSHASHSKPVAPMAICPRPRVLRWGLPATSAALAAIRAKNTPSGQAPNDSTCSTAGAPRSLKNWPSRSHSPANSPASCCCQGNRHNAARAASSQP